MINVLQESETCCLPIEIHLEDAYHANERGSKIEALGHLALAEQQCDQLLHAIRSAKVRLKYQ